MEGFLFSTIERIHIFYSFYDFQIASYSILKSIYYPIYNGKNCKFLVFLLTVAN